MPDAAEVYARWRSSAQSSRFTPPSDFGEAGEGFVFWTHRDRWAFAYRLTFREAIAAGRDPAEVRFSPRPFAHFSGAFWTPSWACIPRLISLCGSAALVAA